MEQAIAGIQVSELATMVGIGCAAGLLLILGLTTIVLLFRGKGHTIIRD